MLLKFSYANEWRHTPSDESYHVESTYDLYKAVNQFRHQHDSYGAVTVFERDNNGVEWRIAKKVDGDINYQCCKCKQYFCERLLIMFEDEIVCYECWNA